MGTNNVIAISGCHGSGKSSVVLLLAAAFKLNGYNIAVLDEVARRCPLRINKESDVDTEKWIICTHIAQEIELTRKFEYVISDRSIIDPYSYAKVSYPDYAATLNQGLLSFIKKHIEDNYLTTIILDKDSFSYQKDDGVRDLDPVFRANVYDTILAVTLNLNIPHKVIHDTEDLLLELNKYGLKIRLPVGLGKTYVPNHAFSPFSDANCAPGTYTNKRA